MTLEDDAVAAEIVEPGGDDPAPAEETSALVERPTPAELGLDLPADHDEATEVLLHAVATARDAAGSYLEDLQRLAAEFENFRKRVQRDREDLIQRSSQRIVESLLPVLDSFDQAFAHQSQSPGEEQILAGVHGTFHQLMDVLGKEGLAMVPGAGEPFDPNVHEAVGGGGNGHLIVAQELRTGYTLNGRVIRPALVTVAAQPEESDPIE
jgi:molecular chaperone GrpE